MRHKKLYGWLSCEISFQPVVGAMVHTPISFYCPEDKFSVRPYVLFEAYCSKEVYCSHMSAIGRTFRSAVLYFGLCEMTTIEAENLVSGLGLVI